jgi:hypothetical protein
MLNPSRAVEHELMPSGGSLEAEKHNFVRGTTLPPGAAGRHEIRTEAHVLANPDVRILTTQLDAVKGNSTRHVLGLRVQVRSAVVPDDLSEDRVGDEIVEVGHREVWIALGSPLSVGSGALMEAALDPELPLKCVLVGISAPVLLDNRLVFTRRVALRGRTRDKAASAYQQEDLRQDGSERWHGV